MPIGKGERPCFMGASTASHLGNTSLWCTWLGGLAIWLRDSAVCKGCATCPGTACLRVAVLGSLWSPKSGWVPDYWGYLGLPAWETSLSTWERVLSAREACGLPAWETALSTWERVLSAREGWGLSAWEMALSDWERVLSAWEACLTITWGEACLPACLSVN